MNTQPFTLFACLLTMVVTLAAFPTAAATKIYRTVDKDGNTVFTDIPPRTQPGKESDAQPLSVEAPNSFKSEEAIPQATAPVIWTGSGETQDEEASIPAYSTLRVVEPASDASVRDNAGNVIVAIGLQPELAPGHSLRLLLDGAVAQQSTSARFALTNVDRGTHSLQVQIVDRAGTIVLTSEPSQFHMQQYSAILAPNAPKPSPHN